MVQGRVVYQQECSVPALPCDVSGLKSFTNLKDGTEVCWEDGAQSLQVHPGCAAEEGMFVRLMSWAEGGRRPQIMSRGEPFKHHPQLAQVLGKRVRVTVEVLD